jgi:hypothetical protein
MQSEITIEGAKMNIGQKVKKRSSKPFKSTFQVNTIKDVIVHPHLQIPAYTFEEDDSYVEARICFIV